MTDPTLEQLRNVASRHPASELSLQLMMWDFSPPAYSSWVELVEKALVYQVGLLAGKRHYLGALCEDALTTVLQIALSNLGMTCDAKVVGGNVDMVVEFRAYKWLGEAKIATDNGKIFHGYQQLTTRYAPGVPNQTSGGMLLYCLDDQASVVMAAWKGALEAEMPGSVLGDGPVPLSFRSVDSRNSAGTDLNIVHLFFPLFHNPAEKSWTFSAESIAAGREARADERSRIAS